MPGIIVKKIDPTGNGDYLTAQAWATDRAQDLTFADNIEVGEIYSGGSVGGVSFKVSDGWVTDATRYPILRAAQGHEHGGQYTTSKAYMQSRDGANPTFYSEIGFVQFGKGIVVESVNGPGANLSDFAMPQIKNVPVGKPVLIEGAIINTNHFVWWVVGINGSNVN